MTTTDTAALLHAVLADPAEDTVRLVYADALEEQGEGDRAEFIRVQVEYAAWERRTGSKYIAGPEVRRVSELLKFHRADWFAVGDMRPWSNGTNDVVWITGGVSTAFLYLGGDVSRGFVSHLTCTTADFLQHAASIFASQPVTGVVLRDKEPEYVGRDPGFPCWRWWSSSQYHEQQEETIPPVLYDRCSGWHPTREEAIADLSDSCVAWGRSLVGLPPLKGRT